MKPPYPSQTSILHSIGYTLHHYWDQELLITKYTILQEKARFEQVYGWIVARTAKQWLLSSAVASGVVVIGLASLTVLFLNPRSHTYSFSDTTSNCFINPVLLPNTFKTSGSETYSSLAKPKFSLGNTPLLSTTTCLELTRIPEQTQDTLTIKSPLAVQKSITLTPDQFPTLTAFESLKEPVSRDAVLLFNINQPDKTFNYTLQIQDKITDCILHDTLLGCPLEKHELAQGQKYSYTIERALNNHTSFASSGDLTTLDPVFITQSSIGQNENVYTKPAVITLTTNKALKSAPEVTLKSADLISHPITGEVKDNSLVLTIASELPRNTNFTLHIENMVANDGASLAQPYELNFKTSAGPQLQNASIGTYKISPTSSITLTFDVELDPAQPIANSVKIADASGSVPSSISIQNNTLTINPADNLNSCTSYTISVNDQLLSKFGVSGGSAWSMQTRTICQQVFSLGSSVQGRGITGYRFGNGATKIVFIGGLHGNEKSSVLTLNSWIDDLERNYANIPADKTVIVIPNTNPDGYNSSSRLNANGIDLNRNFPANNWQPGVHIPGGIYLENGGGSSALSEPESSTVANYLIGASPRLVLTYHATAGAVIYNGSGNSSALSAIYSDKIGYNNLSSAEEDGLFNYPTTGEMEDWLRDKRNVPTLLVELATQYSNNFTRQKSAMWEMLSQ